MTYLLDTNILIGLLRPELRRSILPRLKAQAPGTVATSAIVAHELYLGAASSSRPADNCRQLDLLFQDLVPLAFAREDAEAAGAIRAALKAEGRPIGPYDVLIAGQAMARQLVLVSSNTREFARIAGLRVVDWLAG